MKNPEIEHFTCVCESDEHYFNVKLWDFTKVDDSRPEDVSLAFSLLMYQYRGFWQRVWAAIRYVFGYQCKFGHFESAELKYEDADRLISMIQRFKERVEEVGRVYHSLEIIAPTPETTIFVADSQGFLVQKEIGRMQTRLLPGRYSYQFAVRGVALQERAWIDLTGDLVVGKPSDV